VVAGPAHVLRPDALKISRSLGKTLRKRPFRISLDEDFAAVMAACAEPRTDSQGTWITEDIHLAYQRLHTLGYAHSVEPGRANNWSVDYMAWLGRIFFGESMFSKISDASKIAFAHLVRQLQHWGFVLIDCKSIPGIWPVWGGAMPRANSALPWSATRGRRIAPASGTWMRTRRGRLDGNAFRRGVE